MRKSVILLFYVVKATGDGNTKTVKNGKNQKNDTTSDVFSLYKAARGIVYY